MEKCGVYVFCLHDSCLMFLRSGNADVFEICFLVSYGAVNQETVFHYFRFILLDKIGKGESMVLNG